MNENLFWMKKWKNCDLHSITEDLGLQWKMQGSKCIRYDFFFYSTILRWPQVSDWYLVWQCLTYDLSKIRAVYGAIYQKLKTAHVGQFVLCLAYFESYNNVKIYIAWLRAKKALTLPKDASLRTRRSLYKVYDSSALLVLNRTLLNSINALLASRLMIVWITIQFHYKEMLLGPVS